MEASNNPPQQQTTGDSIVLEEEIDPNYIPTENEVLEYAKWLGMELEKDQDLFWIAREGLMAPLPKSWKPCKTKDTEDIYYFNFSTGESTWDHPCDGYYKRLYEEEKKKKETVIKENNDQKRFKAKQDVEILLGKSEKKKKKGNKTSDLGSIDMSSSVNGGIRHSLEKKPLPGIINTMSILKEPLGAINSAPTTIGSFSTVESSSFKSEVNSNYNEETKTSQQDVNLIAASKASFKLKSAVSSNDGNVNNDHVRPSEDKQQISSDRRIVNRDDDSKDMQLRPIPISAVSHVEDRKESSHHNPSSSVMKNSNECCDCLKIKKEIQIVSDEFSREISSLKSRNKILENQVEDCEQRIQYQKQVINDSQERYDRLDSNYLKKEKELRDRLNDCDNEIETLDKDRKQLRSKLKTLEEISENNETTMIDQQQKIRSLEDSLVKSTKENSDLRDELDIYLKKLRSRDNYSTHEESKELETQLEEQRRSSILLNDNIKQLEMSSKRQLELNLSELENWKSKYEKRDDECNLMKNQIHELQLLFDKLKIENSKLDIDLKTKEVEVIQLQSKQSQMKDEIQRMEQQMRSSSSSSLVIQNSSTNLVTKEEQEQLQSDEILSLKSKITQMETEKGQLVIQVSRQDTELKYARMELNRIAAIEQNIRNLEIDKIAVEKQLELSDMKYIELQRKVQISQSEYEESLNKMKNELEQQLVESNNEIVQKEKKVRLYQEELIQMQRRLNDQQVSSNSTTITQESEEEDKKLSSYCKSCKDLQNQLEEVERLLKNEKEDNEQLKKKIIKIEDVSTAKDDDIRRLQQEANDARDCAKEELIRLQNVEKHLKDQMIELQHQLSRMKDDLQSKESFITDLQQRDLTKRNSEKSTEHLLLLETIKREKEVLINETNTSMVKMKQDYLLLEKQLSVKTMDHHDLLLKLEQLHCQLEIEQKKTKSLETDNSSYKSKWFEVEQENCHLKLNGNKIVDYEVLVERLKQEISNANNIIQSKNVEIENLRTDLNKIKSQQKETIIDMKQLVPHSSDIDKLSSNHTNGLIELSLAVGQQRATIERLEKQLQNTETTINTLKSSNNINHHHQSSPPPHPHPHPSHNEIKTDKKLENNTTTTPESISLLPNRENYRNNNSTPEAVHLLSRQPLINLHQDNRSNGKRNSVKFKNKIQYFDSPSDDNFYFEKIHQGNIETSSDNFDLMISNHKLMSHATDNNSSDDDDRYKYIKSSSSSSNRYMYIDVIKTKVMELSKSCNIHQTNKLLVSSSTPSDSESILKYTGLLEIRIKNEKTFTRELTLFTEEIKKRIRVDQVYISDLKSKWKSSQGNKEINNRSLNAERINSNTVKLNQSVEYIRSTLNLIKLKEKKIKKLANAYVIIHSAIHGTGDIHQISSDFYLSVKKLIIELNSQLISFINISFEVPAVLTKTSPLLNNENYISEKERFDKENNNNNNNNNIGRQKVKNPISYDDLDLRHLSTNQNRNTFSDLPSKHLLQSDKNYSQQQHHLIKQQISKFTSDQKESKDVYEKHVGWLGNLSKEINTLSHRNHLNVVGTSVSTDHFQI